MITATSVLSPAFAFGLAMLTALPVTGQQHRATRLGSPDTRFAPPLVEPEQLRTLLSGDAMKADVASILEQWGWPGDLEDLRRAAATAEIVETKIHPGTVMPFMSARKKGRPVTLREVLWAGKRPVEAYTFVFSSRGQRYRCVTPKPCSNFFVEDLGPEPPPSLRLVKTAPAEVSLCDPFEMRVAVWNSGKVPVTQVRVTDVMPPGLKTLDGHLSLDLTVDALPPSTGRQFDFLVVATAPGQYENQAQAICAEGATASARAITLVRAPVLALDCVAPTEVPLGRPVEICLTVKNTGDAPDGEVRLALPLPEGATLIRTSEAAAAAEGQVVWTVPDLGPDASRTVCATFKSGGLDLLTFAPVAVGACARPVGCRCLTRMVGIPAVLLEAVDLEDPIPVGDQVTYEITVTNQGSAPGTHLGVTCTLPTSQDYVSGSGVTSVTARGRTVVMDPVPIVDPKAQVSWRVVVKATASGDVRFKVELTSDQFQRPIEEYEATTQY